MMILLRKPFSILLVLQIVVALLCGSKPLLAPPPTNPVENTPQTMPAGLMGAFLEASSRPFEFSPEGYRAHSGGWISS